jgi:Protoglobin
LSTGADDIEAIKAVAEKVRPLVPVVVDAVYDKLFKFDITKKHFLPKNEGFQGPTDGNGKVADSLEDLTINNPQIEVCVLFFRTP